MLVVVLGVLLLDIVVFLSVTTGLENNPANVAGTVFTYLALASLSTVLISYLVASRATTRALQPLDEVAAAAHRATGEVTGERLEPSDPTTELGRLASAHDAMVSRFETAIEEAEESDEQARRFLADAAHQLRTPLTTIRAAVELLVIDPDPEQRDEHLTALIRETSRATRVLQSLMTLARLDRGRPPQRVETDLVALCLDELERTRSLAPHLDIGCDAELDRLPAPIDPLEIQEVLANLLDNARRHAESTIVVRVALEDDTARIVVQDDGPGVAPEARRLVFERFATLDGRGGSGLGLPIARAMARGHGGDLDYEDDGFVLTLPMAPQRRAAAGPAA